MAEGQIGISNGDTSDNFVTLTDFNKADHPVVGQWDRRRLNLNDRNIPATVEIDGQGFANINWYAERVSDSTRNNTNTEQVQEGRELLVHAS
jgi:hypothetical protein